MAHTGSRYRARGSRFACLPLSTPGHTRVIRDVEGRVGGGLAPMLDSG